MRYHVALCWWLGWNQAPARLDTEREGAARERLTSAKYGRYGVQ